MDSYGEICSACGRRFTEPPELYGHCITLRCAFCGQEDGGTFYPAEELRLIPKPTRLRVEIVWDATEVTMSDLAVLRKLVHKAREMPVFDLATRIRVSSRFEAGLYWEYDAIQLKEQAERKGLRVKLLEEALD